MSTGHKIVYLCFEFGVCVDLKSSETYFHPLDFFQVKCKGISLFWFCDNFHHLKIIYRKSNMNWSEVFHIFYRPDENFKSSV